MLEKTTRINLLYDFYQNLLTEKQRNYLELYYHEDFSLAEIAEHFNVTRQAVFEQIKRAEQLLEEYESKLQLFAKHEARERLIQLILAELDDQPQVNVEKVKRMVMDLKNVD